MDGFDRYFESLVGSWEALVVPHPSARVVRGDGFAGCRHPNAVFNNAVVLVPHAVRSAQRLFDDDPFALWCRGDDIETAARYATVAAALSTEGYGAVEPIPHAAKVIAAIERNQS